MTKRCERFLKEKTMDKIEKLVHKFYWEKDINCARTMLLCLSEQFGIKLEKQTIHAAIGLHGAGGFRAQCGLVEGALMFIGIYYSTLGKSEEETVAACYQYADAFTQKFSSLRCYDLRPNGFNAQDPPHMCEKLTCEAVEFAIQFIKDKIAQ